MLEMKRLCAVYSSTPTMTEVALTTASALTPSSKPSSSTALLEMVALITLPPRTDSFTIELWYA